MSVISHSFTTKRRTVLKGCLGSASVMATLVASQPAQAVILTNQTNTISLCSGVQLPASEVTDLLKPVATTVGSLETATNGLLGTVLGSALGLQPVTTDLSGVLTAASNGYLTVKAVSTDGSLVSPSPNCYAAATGMTLTNPAGISIGGNTITGLGDRNQISASAGELNSIAFGNAAATSANALNSMALGSNASVGASGTNSIAIGSLAQANVANSVALGAGSTAARGALTGYTGFALGTAQSSVGEVSVGTSSGARQITNVAAGSQPNDAVNVAQLSAVNDSLTTLGSLAVKYDASGRTSITLGGSGGTTITNLRAGNLSSSSTDAVNGSQLYTTNQSLANNTTNITNLTNGATGVWRYATPAGVPNGGTLSNDVTVVGSTGPVGLHNIGVGALSATSTDAVNGSQLFTTNAKVSQNTINITQNTTDITNLGTNLTALGALAVKYDASNKQTVSLGGTGGTTITNLRAGDVSSTSIDAVNGSQLYSTNVNVSNLSNSLTATNSTVTNIANGAAGVWRYSDASGTPNGGVTSNDVTVVGSNGPVGIHNVANGVIAAGSNDAVNGGQIFALDQRVATNTTTINTIGNSLTTLDSLAVKYSGSDHNTINLGGNAGTRISNLAAGDVSLASTDAVNGAQLYATNQNVSSNTSNITNLTNSLATTNTNITNITSGAAGVWRYATAAGTPNGGVASNDVTVIGAGGPVGLHNIGIGALNSTSTDAVNGSQLFATNANVSQNTTNITQNTTDITNLGTNLTALGALAVKYDASNKQTISLGGTGGTIITNLRAGDVSSASTDAVNGAQLYATNQSISNNVSTINTTLNTIDNRVTQNTTNITSLDNRVSLLDSGGVGTVQYSNGGSLPNGGTPTQDLTLIGATSGAVHLHNVADGSIASGSTDAVNGAQLYATNQNVSSNTSNITNLTNSLATTNTSITNITSGAAGVWRYATAAGTPNGGVASNDVTVIGAGGPVSLHNIGIGALSPTSTDAVNGSQLFATNANVSQNTTNITQNTTDITNLGTNLTALGALAVKYDASNKQTISLGGTGGTIITNLRAGDVSSASTDAVNGAQLYATNQSISNNVSTINTTLNTIDNRVTQNTTNITSLDNRVSLLDSGGVGPVQYSNGGSLPNGGTPTQDLTLIGATSGAVHLHNVADGSIASGSTDAVNGGQIFALSRSVNSLTDLAVSYDNSNRTSVTLGGANATSTVSLDNISAGRLGQTSTDAVNGSQLFATNQSISTLSTSVTNIDNRLTQNANTLTSVDGRVTTNTNNINSIDNRVTNIDARSTLLANGGLGTVQYSNGGPAANGGVPTQDLTLVGAATGAVRLHNVADGVVARGSTDAVNGGQLFDAVNQGVAELAVTYDDASHTKVSLGGANSGPVTLTNLKAGTLSQTSSDAVNGAQLYATNQSISSVSNSVSNVTNLYNTLNTQVSQNSADLSTVSNNFNTFSSQVANGGVGPVQYSSTVSPTTTDGGVPSQDLTLVGVGSGPVGLHNVAAGVLGVGSTDAVNGAQLSSLGTGMAATLGGFSYNATTNSFQGNFSFGGNSYSNVQAVLGAIYADQSSGIPADGKYFHANSTMADSSASGQDSTAIGPASSSQGSQSVAMGANSTATSDQSVAIGAGATAKDGRSVSIGQGNTASGNGAVALGDPSIATGDGAIVAGKDDTATGTGAIAMGNTSSAVGNGAVSLGNVNTASGIGAVALGSANAVSGLGAVAIGSNNSVTGDGSLAIGSGIKTSANDTLTIGNNTVASNVSAVAFGNRATAAGLMSLSVGTDTSASGQEASSYGADSHATADFATAVGSGAKAGGTQSVALGSNAVASAIDSTAVGGDAQATNIYASAIGEMATASGLASAAVGNASTASGYASAALGTGSIANKDGSVALGVATQTVRGAVADYSAFGVSGSQSSQGEVAIARNISYTDPNTGLATVTGNRQITGLAAGSADTDGVNVAQLKGVSSSLGTVMATALGGGASYNFSTGAISSPTYTFGGVTYSNVGDALLALAGNGTGSGTGTGTGTGGASNNDTVTYSSGDHSSLALASTGTKVENVAAGTVSSTSTDAVNGSQLNATNQRVSQLANQVDTGQVGAVRYSNAATPTTPNGGTKTNDVTLVGANTAAPVAVHNVADGTVAAGSTDAVNGGQLAATNTRVATVEGTADSALSMGQNSVQYDNSAHTSATLGDGATPVAVHNVADGISPRDAANIGQVTQAMAGAVSQANAYTDGRIMALSFDLKKVNRNANAGTAGAMAMASMPQPYEAGKGMVSMGMATYQGQRAIAVGASKAFNDGHTIMKMGATYNSSGSVGVSVGAGYQF